MNKIIITGNLTRDPEQHATPRGDGVCSFTVAVDRRGGKDKGSDYFRVSAWRQLGETCFRYLKKGRKVAVVGELQARTYEGTDGQTRVSLDVTADEVEFLSPKQEENNDFADVTTADIPF